MSRAECASTTLHKKWNFLLTISSVNVTKHFMENFIFCAVLEYMTELPATPLRSIRVQFSPSHIASKKKWNFLLRIFFSITSFFIKECSLTFANWKGNIYWYEHLVIHFISVSDQGDFSFVPKMSKGYIFYLESRGVFRTPSNM